MLLSVAISRYNISPDHAISLVLIFDDVVAQGDSDRQFTRLLLVAPLTLAYLILDELYVLETFQRISQG